MAGGWKALTVAAVFCQCLIEAECHIQSASCSEEQEETSLMQVRRDLVLSTERAEDYAANTSANLTLNITPVEAAENEWKAAKSNTSIEKYAQSVTRLEEAKAIWESVQKTMIAEGRTTKMVAAERAAHDAEQAAQDEVDAVRAAVAAERDAALAAAVAQQDAEAKHDTLRDATAAANNATQARTAAEANLDQTQTVQQMAVNDAAAEQSAKAAHVARVEAAAKAAAQRKAAADSKVHLMAERAAQKASWKAHQLAVHDEWHAAQSSWKTQRELEKQAGADVLSKLAEIAGTAENATAAPAVTAFSQMNTELIQPATTVTTESVETVTTQTVETESLDNTSTNLDNVTFNASHAVQAKQELVAEAASDEKKAKSRAYVTKYAADHAAWAKKVAERKSDAAWRRAQHLSHHADILARKAREAVAHVNVTAWELESASAHNTTAADVKYAAEHFTYDKAADFRHSMSEEDAALQAWKEAQAASKRQAIIDEAASDEIDAQTDAEHAAKMRVLNDVATSDMEEAEESAHDAHGNLREASEAEHDANHAYMSAEHEAGHDANQAEKFDAKAAAADLDRGVNVTEINATLGDLYGDPDAASAISSSSSTVVTSSSSSSSSR